MKLNNRGIVVETVLVYVLIGMVLLFVPNPISNVAGVGVRPNKTVYTEKVEFIKDSEGNPIATKTTVRNDDIQQKVTFWEWLTSLPIFVLFLMSLGVVFPPIALFLGKLWNNLNRDTRKIVVGVDKAMSKVKDDELKKLMLLEMGNVQNDSTKKLVDKIQGK